MTLEIGNLYNLEILWLCNNKLKLFPLEIVKLQNLEELNLSNNELASLPNEIGNLPNLKIFDITNNQLEPGKQKTIPELREAWQSSRACSPEALLLGKEYQELSRNIKSARKF